MPGWWNGRHAGFKIPFSQGSPGSSPGPGTFFLAYSYDARQGRPGSSSFSLPSSPAQGDVIIEKILRCRREWSPPWQRERPPREPTKQLEFFREQGSQVPTWNPEDKNQGEEPGLAGRDAKVGVRTPGTIFSLGGNPPRPRTLAGTIQRAASAPTTPDARHKKRHRINVRRMCFSGVANGSSTRGSSNPSTAEFLFFMRPNGSLRWKS